MPLVRRIKKVLSWILKRPKGLGAYCRDLFSALVRREAAWGLPVHITIEPANICNLSCPVCETGSGIMKREKGAMAFDDFRLIIDRIKPHTNSILFYYMGEPFLNPDAYRMVRYAKQQGIYVTACTNGHHIKAKEMIDSLIDEISFQISGITEESHRKYRVGSELGIVLDNLKELVRVKKNTPESATKIILGLIVMRHNEGELGGFYKLAGEIGVDEARVLCPRVRSWEQGREFLPEGCRYWFYDKKAFEDGVLKLRRPPRNRCLWMYFSSVILQNGDVVPCCRDFQGKHVMGNILKESFSQIWNNKKYRSFRKEIREGRRKADLCCLCPDFGIPTLYTLKGH